MHNLYVYIMKFKNLYIKMLARGRKHQNTNENTQKHSKKWKYINYSSCYISKTELTFYNYNSKHLLINKTPLIFLCISEFMEKI